MRAHIMLHVPFEGPGNIEPWLKMNGYRITSTQFFKSVQFPEPQEVDFLVIMGGPMSVNDENGFPWIVAEKQFIRDCIHAGKRVLGICFGAQIIASAMGARVYRNLEKEIGWFPVQGIPSPDESIFRFPASFEVFHWHGETFDLPPGAVQLAKSEGCENQAFQLGQSVLGLQFHIETTPESLNQMIVNCRAELLPSKFIQSENEILAAGHEKYQLINKLLDEVLKWLLSPTQNSRFKI